MSITDTFGTLEERIASQRDQVNAKSNHLNPNRATVPNTYSSSNILPSDGSGFYMEKALPNGSYPDLDELNPRTPSADIISNEKLELNLDSSTNHGYLGQDLDTTLSKYSTGIPSYLTQESLSSPLMHPGQATAHESLSKPKRDNSESQQQQHISPETEVDQSKVSTTADSSSNASKSEFIPPFTVDIDMVRRTMKGVNEVLGVDLSGTEVNETALQTNPNYDAQNDSSEKDSTNSKSEMSHVRLISDACGHIVVSVAKSVLESARESANENILRGRPNQPPKPPIRKKRGGVLGFKELAMRANLSPWHFHRVFRFVTGVTPKAYGEALWEYLMIQSGFDLTNEELNINQVIERKGMMKDTGKNSNASSSSTGSPQSPVSNSSIPSVHGNSVYSNGTTSASHHNNLDMDASNFSSSGGIGDDTPSEEQSSSTSPTNQNSNAKQANSNTQPLVPLSGSVAPGRIRKASSRSRGARSRSRNRSQTQSQILTGLSIDSGSTPDTPVLSRGRSFSRASHSHPYVEPSMPYFTPGSAISDGNPSDSNSPEDINQSHQVKSVGMMNGMHDDFALSSSNIPDLNNLSIQNLEAPMTTAPGETGIEYNMNMAMEFNNNHFYGYGNQGTQYSQMGSHVGTQMSPIDGQIGPQIPQSGSQISHHMHQPLQGGIFIDGTENTQSRSAETHVNNPTGVSMRDDCGDVFNYNAHFVDSQNSQTNLMPQGKVNRGEQDGPYSQSQYEQSMNFINSSAVNLNDTGADAHVEPQVNSIDNSFYDTSAQTQKQNPTSAFGNNVENCNNDNRRSPNTTQLGTVNPKSTSSSSTSIHSQSSNLNRFNDILGPGMHRHSNSFHSIENPLSSIRESFNPPGIPGEDISRSDQYGDLPDFYLANNGDQVLEDDLTNSDAYLSVLIGDEDPPLMPTWNVEERSDYNYHY